MIKKALQNLLLVTVLWACAAASHSSEFFQAKVIGVSDGDTITVLKEGVPLKLRLNGIDCPEKSQDFGQKAKDFTSELVFSKQVLVFARGKDRYKRTIAEVYLSGGENLSDLLIARGYAWWYRSFSKEIHRQILEEKAKAEKLGLWKEENAFAPWDFRKSQKQASKTSAGKPRATVMRQQAEFR